MATALVTGASRGVGRGVAIALADAGFTVHATGRSIADADLPSSITRHRCDHLHDMETAGVFERLATATDKLTADAAHELRPHGVSVVSLYPGLVRTEAVLAAAEWLDLSNSESPEFIGRVIAALTADPNVLERSGQVLVAASMAQTYDITDVDGRHPVPLTLAAV